jgi:hypothetical protein
VIKPEEGKKALPPSPPLEIMVPQNVTPIASKEGKNKKSRSTGKKEREAV